MSDWQLSSSPDVSLKPTHLSCLGGGASCPEGASPWGLLGPGASPWGAPWGASSQEVVPSYLQETDQHLHSNNRTNNQRHLSAAAFTWGRSSSAHWRRGSPSGWILGRRSSDAGAGGGGGHGPSALRGHDLRHRRVRVRTPAPENTPLATRQTLPAVMARPLHVLAPPDQQGPEAWGPLLEPPDPQPGPHPDLRPHLPTEPGQYRSAGRERVRHQTLVGTPGVLDPVGSDVRTWSQVTLDM